MRGKHNNNKTHISITNTFIKTKSNEHEIIVTLMIRRIKRE